MGQPMWLSILLSYIFILSHLSINLGVDATTIGVNWGTQSSHPLPPQTVIRFLRANKITKVKLFDSDSSLLRALANTGIEVMVAIPNEVLKTLGDPALATSWVDNNVLRYVKSGTDIRYVAVGNEPYLRAYNGTFIDATYPALKNIQAALNNAKVGGKVKATVPLNADILYSTDVPSATTFRPDIAKSLLQLLEILGDNGSPFTINVYPFLSLYFDKNFPVNYAFFDGTGVTPVRDGPYTYTNVFDASYDSLLVALTKANYGNMTIIIGEIGWPTDGDVNANIDYAKKFNQGFASHMAANKGTPRRPNIAIDSYVFSLIDEDMKTIAPGNFERHWGILRYDGKPKYSLSVTGDGGKDLVPVSGVKYLKSQWCVLNPNAANISILSDSIQYACTNGDCTELGYGSSCHNYLDANGNASFAFNSYYQRQNQEKGACSFNGLGQVVTSNPSKGNCEFIIQLAYASSGTSSSPSKQTGLTSDTPWLTASTFLLALLLLLNLLNSNLL